MQATRKCSITDCDRPHFGKGLCQRHLERKRRDDRKAASAPRCSIEDCDQPAVGRSWCEGHYRRWLDHGDPTAGRRSPVGGTCSVDACNRLVAAEGWCALHYYRWKRTGDVGPAEPMEKPVGSDSPHWRGDNIGYHTAHSRVSRLNGPAASHDCVDCGQPAAQWSYDHQDPDELRGSGENPYLFSLKPEHYQSRCAACHCAFDNARRTTAS